MELPFKIYPDTYPNGTPCFRVDGRWKGERTRKFFADATGAEQFCKQKNDEAVLQSSASESLRLRPTRLTEAEIATVEGALLEINERWPLVDVLRGGIRALESKPQSRPIADLAEEWLALIEKEVSARWYDDLRDRVRYFVRDHPGMTTVSLDGGVVRKWLDGLKLTPTTKRNYRGALHRWGGWLKERGHVAVNPFSDIRILAPKGGAHRAELPSVLLPIQAEAFMRGVLQPRSRRLLGWASLALFGGLRPLAEAPHRVWPEINFKTGEVSVLGRKRGARLRVFKAQPLLLEWLEVAKADGVPTPGRYLRKLREAALEWANGWLAAKGHPLIEWNEDVLRHSYASYRAGQGASVVDLAAEMGTGTSMIYSHYRNPRNAADVKAFWKILPGNLIQQPS